MTSDPGTFYKRLSVAAAATTICLCAASLYGLMIGDELLARLSTNWVTMKVNTAVGLVCCGLAVILMQGMSNNKLCLWAFYACCLASLALGLLTWCEYYTGVGFSIDQLLIHQIPGVSDLSPPGRPSVLTASVLLLNAVALLLLGSFKTERLVLLGQGAALASGTIGLAQGIGYLYDAKPLLAAGNFTPVAVSTAICFILLAIGIVLTRPRLGLMRTFTSDDATGRLLRPTVSFALFAPILLGYLQLLGHKSGWYSSESGVAIMVGASVVIAQTCVFWLTRRFHEVEQRLQKREEQFRQQAELLNLTQDSVMVRDLNQKILFWNHGAEVFYGFTAEQAIGQQADDLLNTKFPCPLEAITDCLSANSHWSGELTRKTSAGKSVVVTSRWSLNRDAAGEPSGVLEINSDVSAAKEAEKRVSEFYSTVSHELRTPLTSIKGALRLMEGGVAGELPARAKELVRMGSVEAERLIRLINDILDIRKIEADMLELTIVDADVASLVSVSIGLLAHLAATQHVKLTSNVDIKRTISVDKDRVAQALTNLVSNAIKFSPRDTEVSVSVTDTKDAVRFSVRDHGQGIAAEHLPKLFQMFQQVDSSDARAKGGTGLGLAITKSLVERHGGTIGVDSEVGVGSTFWFELPAKSNAITIPEPNQVTASSARVLIVEDNDFAAQIVKMELKDERYTFDHVSTLAGAKEALTNNRPEAVILDLGLEDGDGIELLSFMHENDILLPVIVVTGRAVIEESGYPLMIDWITKPYDETRLAKAVQSALNIRTPGAARVLIAEDDPLTRAIIKQHIAPFNVECFEAMNGPEAIELAKKVQPDLIILDVGLPSIDGFSVVDALKSSNERQTPLLVFTAKDLSSEDRSRLKLGITVHLTKTVTSDSEFISTVRTLLNGLTCQGSNARTEKEHVEL
jgi:PAS domain S-box-containing protein